MEAYGIAPPFEPLLTKKRCWEIKIGKVSAGGSTFNTHLVSQFGATACKALFQCDNFKNPSITLNV